MNAVGLLVEEILESPVGLVEVVGYILCVRRLVRIPRIRRVNRISIISRVNRISSVCKAHRFHCIIAFYMARKVHGISSKWQS